ncbi:MULTISPECIES: Trk system potassium transporter TrkA [unclassified Aureispira]|uniref:Trk system potassium transporter TrkA n=1 Tax=unclassified Aureispira TaxID=2649989 RepID=UPI000697DBF2|nr:MULTISPECIES: Trk system potassium transporter TrkA [unclassified Aureispira]WMX16254.1 Trk system potassium transporter TrkA [Aureispira sp. CCB-E]
MKIIIAGAGAVGFHLAELLSKENQDITLIDYNSRVLEHAATHLDVMTLKGDATSTSVLKEAQASTANLFIAVTTSESTNLLLAILAKQAGAQKTIARVNNPEYFEAAQLESFQSLGIDSLISPQLLAAQEVERLLNQGSCTDVFDFENGKISVVGFTLDNTCPLINKTIYEIDQANSDFNFRGVSILRGYQTIIPHGSTILEKGDHLYIAAEHKNIDKALNFAGKQLKPIKRVMIIGGTPLALQTARLLENQYEVSVIVPDKEIGKRFVEKLHHTLVIHADASNIDVLKEEGLARMDAFVALTPNSETNIITSLMAEELGIYKTIALVEDVNYTHISKNIGVDTIINKKLIAANKIFRFIRKGKIKEIISLNGVNAEIIEFEVHKKNRLLKHPIKDLHLPQKSIIAGVVRGNESHIPDGDFMFQINDKVIVFAQPEAIHQVEELFK